MAKTVLYSRVKQLVIAVGASPSTGQGDLSLGSAYAGDTRRFNDVATSGVLTSYMIKEGVKWERGEGTPVTGSPWTFQRTNCFESSAGVGVKEVFTAAAVIWCVENPEDFSERDVRGRHALYLSAAAFTPAVTNGPSLGTFETATNKDVVNSLDFDASTVESAQSLSFALPPSYDGGPIRVRPYWTHGATATNFGVTWRVSAAARGDNEAIDLAFGTTVNVSDTGGTTDRLYIAAETADITPAGTPQPLDLMHVKIERLVSDGSDTMAIDARLLGLQVYYSVNAPTD